MTGKEISPSDLAVLARLVATIGERRAAPTGSSYTAGLLADPDQAVRKFGEEALEVVIAAMAPIGAKMAPVRDGEEKGPDPGSLTREAADLVYHLLVLCEARGVDFAEVLAELRRREGVSGLAEKAARSVAGAKKGA